MTRAVSIYAVNHPYYSEDPDVWVLAGPTYFMDVVDHLEGMGDGLEVWGGPLFRVERYEPVLEQVAGFRVDAGQIASEALVLKAETRLTSMSYRSAMVLLSVKDQITEEEYLALCRFFTVCVERGYRIRGWDG